MWQAIVSFVRGVLERLKLGLVEQLPAKLSATFSADPSSSSSRLNQTLIVINMVAMLWYSLIKWGISDLWKAVAIALIVNGLVTYGASKLKE